MVIQNEIPYIPLEPKAKKLALAGALMVWAHYLMFVMTMPAAMPTIMQGYDMMGWSAILGGVCSVLACVAVPIGGKLGDQFGRRKVCLLVGYTLFALLILAAFRTNRVIFSVLYAGISLCNGILSPYPLTILSDLSTTKERPKLVGIYSALNGIAYLAGMVMGGVITDYIGPHFTFVFFMPIGLLGILFLTLYYPNKAAEHHASIDKKGLVLMVCSISSILVWCSFGGTQFPRFSPLGISLLVLGGVLLAVLLWVEKRTEEPLIDLTMFRYKPFVIAFVSFAVIPFMTSQYSSQLILFGQLSLGLTATMSATLTLPKNLVFAIFPPLVSRLLTKDSRRYRKVFLTYGIVLAIGSTFVATWGRDTSIWYIYAVMAVIGICSCVSNSFPLYAQITLPQRRVGMASSMIMFGSSFGTAVCSAVYNVVYNQRYQRAMELGGGEHLADAIAEIFSIMARFTVACGVIITVCTLLLVPRGEPKRYTE